MKYLIIAIFICLLSTYIKTAHEEELAKNLFGDKYKEKIYSGYLATTDMDRKLHYVFVPSQSNPETDPVVLWLNGGPGCSSLLGFIQEHGPVIIPDYTNRIEVNPFSWNKKANMLYLESPAGVGFSYSLDGEEEIQWNDELSGRDNRAAIIHFFKKFPEFLSNEFYISGESYAGIYVPYLAKLLITNKDSINLRGILVGNGLTDLNIDLEQSLIEFAFDHALYSYETYQNFKTVCKESPYNAYGNQVTKACNKVRLEIKNSLKGINIYDIYRECPAMRYPYHVNSSQQTTLKTLQNINKNYKEKKPMSTYIDLQFLENYRDDLEPEVQIWPEGCWEDPFPAAFFNMPQIKKALNVRSNIKFQVCNDKINMSYTMGESYDIYKDILIPSGLKIWFYSGDTDGAVPVNGSIKWIYNLGLKPTEDYRGWFVNGQNAGFVQTYGNFKFITIKGTGHMAPQWKREESFIMFNSFLNGENLPY